MSATLEPAIIGGASAVLGGIVVAVSNYALNRSQVRARDRDGLRKALVAFLDVVNRVDYALRVEPVPGRGATWLNRQVGRAPLLQHAVGRLHQRLFEPQQDTLLDRMHAASAAVLLVAPFDMLPAFEAISELMARAEERDDQWRQDWDRARGDLLVACRQSVGTPKQPVFARIKTALRHARPST